MHLFGLARRHQEKSILKKMQKIMPNFFRKKYLKRINNPNPFFYSKRREGHLASKTYRSLLQKLSGPKSDPTFLLFLASSLRGINIFKGFFAWKWTTSMDGTKQDNKRNRNSTFITSKTLLSVPWSIFSIWLGENLHFNFQTLRELRSSHRFTLWLWGAVDDQMLPSTDWIQCVFQKVPLTQWDDCNFFKKSCQDFVHGDKFESPVSCPSFTAAKYQVQIPPNLL